MPRLSMTGGQALVQALAAHGVEQVFGIPGTHSLEIYRHLDRYGLRHLTPRHEQGAGYAADGYARVSGRPGVALTTTGPALLNIAAAVGQAYSDSVPLLVISPGMPLRHPAQSVGSLHEMRSQTDAMRNIAAFSHRVGAVGQIGAAVARAFALFAGERPRPVHVEIPLDLLGATEPVGGLPTAPARFPAQADPTCLSEAAETLARAARPALVLGGGARGAAAKCLALAELLGAPVVTTANGKGIVSEFHPLSAGVALHSPAVQEWLVDRDVVLAVGTELGESDYWCEPPRLGGTLIRVDLDPAQMYNGQPAGIPLVGDAATVLRALTQLVSVLLPQIQTRAAAIGGDAMAAAMVTGPAAAADLRAARNHQTRGRDARWIPYLNAIREVLAPDAVITSDSAMCCYYGALPHLPIPAEGRYLHPTGFGTLGYALPAAIGAKAAAPDRQVLALSGDGGLQFTVQELATAVQLRQPLPIVVFDNGGYGEIRNEMAARGDRPTAVDLPSPDLPALARAYGGRGECAANPAQLAAALRTALSAPGPTVIVVPEEKAP